MFSLFVTGSHRYDSVRPLSYADADLIMICFSVAEPDSMDHAISRVSDAINDVIFTFNEIKKKKSRTLSFMCVKFFSFNFRKKPNEFWICVWNNFGFFFSLVGKWSPRTLPKTTYHIGRLQNGLADRRCDGSGTCQKKDYADHVRSGM